MNYTNAEIRQAGQVIRCNVELYANIPATGPEAAQVQWQGVLRPPNNTGLEIDERYTLALPDCSPVTIKIMSEANHVDGSVKFKGVGAPPAPSSAREAVGVG